MSRYFALLNAGKRSIVLDLKDPANNATARALAREADVVVENNRPGVMRRLGLSHQDLAGDNPALIYCSISGFGQTGPGALTAAYAPNTHAFSGYDLANLAYQDPGRRDRPANTAIFLADALAAVYACSAIEAALIGRARTGQGQYIDLAPRRSVYAPMPTSDGFVSVAPVSQKQFEALMAVIDERFLIIARTDARTVNGMEDAIERMEAYIEAGADIGFVEAPQSLSELEEIPRRLPNVPLLANIFEVGKTPFVKADELRAMGYRIGIYPSQTRRAALRAIERVLRQLRSAGGRVSTGDVVSFSEREALIESGRWAALEQKYLHDVSEA